jgi:hypothetical protein
MTNRHNDVVRIVVQAVRMHMFKEIPHNGDNYLIEKNQQSDYQTILRDLLMNGPRMKEN